VPGSPTILQIIPRLDTGGAEITTLEVTEAIVKSGGRALVATQGGRLAAEVARLGGEIVTFRAATKNPAAMLANAARLGRLIRKEGIALLHARSRAPAWSALIAARRARIPFVTTYHGAYGGEGALKTWYNGVMARGDIVIANSDYTGALIASRHKAPEARIRVIHRGVDLESFDPARVEPSRVAALSEAWGVKAGERVVLQAARLTGWKGQRVLVEAARQLGAADATYILAGDAQGRDGYAEELQQQIVASGLEGRVRLVGHCSDMAAAFLIATVTVVASTEPEAFGRATTEALAMGSPVIVTDLGAPPETLRGAGPGRGGREALGWIVPPGDARALARALAEALALPVDERQGLARLARSHLAEHFSKVRLQRETLAVYDELLGTELAPRFARPVASQRPA
jgi:glycosyltransferase involved in cell wall biosynthesis